LEVLKQTTLHVDRDYDGPMVVPRLDFQLALGRMVNHGSEDELRSTKPVNAPLLGHGVGSGRLAES
jgi:hypothetical protein